MAERGRPHPTDTPRSFGDFDFMLPEGAVPTVGFAAVSFIDSEGHRSYCWQRYGDEDLATFLGVMEMIRLEVARVATREDEDDG